MIYLLILIILILFIGIWYFQKQIKLPANVDGLLREIRAEGLPELMPGKQGFANNGKVFICYELIESQGGKKGTILLLNGHSQTMLGYPPHFYQPFLAAGYQIVRMDNRGTGQSSWVNDWTKLNPFTLEDMASDSIAVLDKLNLDKVHVIGYSMGGMIGQRLAISYPERVASLTAQMTSGWYNDPHLTGLSKSFLLKLVFTFLVYARNLNTNEAKSKLHLAVNRLLKGKNYPFDDKEILQKAMYENIRRSGYNMRVEKPQTLAIETSGSRYEELKNIAAPTLVIHGTADPLVLLEHGEKFAPMIPNAKTLFIKNLGHHFPFAHTPEITDVILTFIERQ